MESPQTPPHPKSARKGPVTFLVALVLLGLLFFAGLVPKLRANEQLNKDAKEVGQEMPIVQVISPKLESDDPLTLPGTLQAISETSVQARTSGYVSQLLVDIGSRVKKGQLLALIESPDVDQQLAQAGADTAKSQATVGQSLADLSKLSAGVVQSQADSARQNAAVRQAQAQVAGASAKVAQAKSDLSGAKSRLTQSQQQVSVQQANLAQAQAQYDLAEATEKRYRALLAQGFVAQQDYDQQAATLKTSAAAVTSAKASIRAAEAEVKSSENAVTSSEAAVTSAAADLAAAKENVGAQKELLKSTQASVEASRASVDSGKQVIVANRAQVLSNIANERRYAVQRSFERIVAPFDGVITARNIDIGSLVIPGTNDSSSSTNPTPQIGLFGIARTDVLRVQVSLPQTFYRSSSPGEMADVFIRELPKRVFRGAIYDRSGAIDPTSRTLLAEIRIRNENDSLVPGMYAQVRLKPATAQESIRVPADTLMFDSQGTRVVTVDDSGVAHLTPVKVGRDFGKEIEILSGVKTSDHLVDNPGDDLKDGIRVQVEGK